MRRGLLFCLIIFTITLMWTPANFATASTTTSTSVNTNNIGATVTTTTNNVINQITTGSTQLIAQANQTAQDLWKNATIYAQNILKQAQEFSKQSGLLGETVATSLALVGLGESYTSYEKMQNVCNALTWVNHFRQCTIHKYTGYWCCAVKNKTTGLQYCKFFTDADAKKAVGDTKSTTTTSTTGTVAVSGTTTTGTTTTSTSATASTSAAPKNSPAPGTPITEANNFSYICSCNFISVVFSLMIAVLISIF